MKRQDLRAPQGNHETNARKVPLVVPHAGPAAGADFECAFDHVRRDAEVHKLWVGASGKQDIRRAS
jgi:hypothetical protein